MIAPNCLREILETCEKNDLDLLLFCFDIYSNGHLIERKRPWEELSKPCTGLEFWKMQVIPHQGEISQVWTQIYRRDFLDEKRIFSPAINMAEDESYTYSSFLQSRVLFIVNKAYYIYRQNPASLTSSLKKVPTPSALYEESYTASLLLYRLIALIPSNEQSIRQSIKNVIQYKLNNAWKVMHIMSSDSITSYRLLCLKDFFSNLFVFRVLNHRQLLQYLRFLFFCMPPAQ